MPDEFSPSIRRYFLGLRHDKMITLNEENPPRATRAACLGAQASEIIRMLNEAGFENVTIDKRPGTGERNFVASALIQGRKPLRDHKAV